MIDRYVIRQLVAPFSLSVLVFTFILVVPEMMRYAETLIAKGVSTGVVLRLMATLLPYALALTIPISLLLALLVAFGRLSADRELVALQACGVSLARLLRPVAAVSVLCWAATAYVMIVALPSSNQTFREIVFTVTAERAEGEVRPRVFFDYFPNLMLYVREVPSSGAGWDGVFLADSRPGQPHAIYLARRGRVLIDRAARRVELVLEDGSRHVATAAEGDEEYEVFRFERVVLNVDPDTVFPSEGPAKGPREMTLAELQARATMLEAEGLPSHAERMAMHHRFSIPVACLVFGLIGLGLGATNRRDGTLGSFVLGLLVIFVYYIPLYLGPQMAKGAIVAPWMAAWLPNFFVGGIAIALFAWRGRAGGRPLRVSLPRVVARRIGARLPSLRLRLPGVSLLDRYVVASYGRVLLLAGAAMLGVFYISTFIDLSDKVFKAEATWTMLGLYLWYATPQYLYYIVPMSVLLATIVTIAALTKNSELVVMKACGISLYRVAAPMLAVAALAALALFALEETGLGAANRRAEAIRHVMRGGSPEAFDVLHRQWLVDTSGHIYHYEAFDPHSRQLVGLSIFEMGHQMRQLSSRTFAERALYIGDRPDAAADLWQLERGWTREFDERGDPGPFTPLARTRKHLEPVLYFSSEAPDPEFMSYTELRRHTARLESSGFSVVEQEVALARKVSFPFVTLVMTLIAIPFAVTVGRSGTMAGIGVGMALALGYWGVRSIFAAMGLGGALTPELSAWAPNLLFGAGAVYLLLTVRT